MNSYGTVKSKWDEEVEPDRAGRPSFKTEILGRRKKPSAAERLPSPEPAPVKITKEAKLYNKQCEETGRSNRDERSTKSRERRSKSRERRPGSRDRGSRRSRSRSKGRRRSRSRDRDRGRDLKRSRSRSKDRGSRDLKRDLKDDSRRDLKDDLKRPRSRSRDRRDRRDWREGRGGGGGHRGGGRRGSDFERAKDEHRKQIEEQFKKAEEMGVEMPKYYKPGAVNPLNYAEQVQKRKMLWKKPGSGGGEEEAKSSTATPAAPASQNTKIFGVYEPQKKVESSKPSSGGPVSFNKWEATNFGDDSANEKFRRLMGIKAAPKPDEFSSEDAPGKHATKIMSDLEKGYEVARQQTHRNRGIGLGFSSMEPQQPYVNPRAMEHHQPYVNPHVRQTEAQAAGYGQQPGSLGHHPGHQGQGYGGHQGNQSVNPFGGGRGGRGGFGINFVKKM